LENQDGGKDIEKILMEIPVNETILLHKNLSINDVDVKYEGLLQNRLNFSLSINTHSNLMYEKIGKIIVEDKKEKKTFGNFMIFSSDKAPKFDAEFIVKIIIGVFAFVFLIFALRTVHKIVND